MPEIEMKKAETKVFDPIWLNTTTGAVTVYGHEFVSKHVLNIIGACLNSPEFDEDHHGVFSLVFSTESIKDSDEKEVYAMFFPEVKSIVVNLSKMWDNAMEEALSEDKLISVVCALHHNLLFHIFHDIHHAASYAGGVNIFDLTEEEHEKSSAWANEKIIELAKTIDIEPDWKAEPFFGPMIEELFINLKEDEKDVIALRAKELIEKDIMVSVTGDAEDDNAAETKITTFRDYIKILSEDEEGWEEELLKKNFLNEMSTIAQVVEPTTATMAQEQEDDEVPDEVPWDEPQSEGILFGGGAIKTTGHPETLVAATFGANPVQTPVIAPVSVLMGAVVAPVTPVAVKPLNYPTNNIDPATVPAIMAQVFMTCYQHIFTGCGLLTNSDIAFQAPEFVTQTPIDLNSIPGAAAIVVAADINDAQGNWAAEKQLENGQLFGNIKKNTKLPGYTLHLNVNGVHHIRALIPQNPNTGSTTAVRARAGNAIMWIVDNATARDDSNRWKFKIDNGIITPCTARAAA